MRYSVSAVLAAAFLTSSLLPLRAQPTPAAASKQADPQNELHAITERTVAPTAKFQFGPDALRSAELRVPEGKGPFPVAVLLHGGCFVKELGGTGLQPFAEMLRKRGIATWDVDYRRLGHQGAGWPGSFQDVATGVDYLTTIAPNYPLDMSRVIVVGHSAGAAFAYWTASRAKLDGPLGANSRTPKFRSVVLIDGPAVLSPYTEVDEQICGRHVIAELMGGLPTERPGAYRQGEATSRLPLGIRELYVKAALVDLLSPWIEKIRKGGDTIEVLTPPDADHFDIITPGKKNGEDVADWIREKAF